MTTRRPSPQRRTSNSRPVAPSCSAFRNDAFVFSPRRGYPGAPRCPKTIIMSNIIVTALKESAEMTQDQPSLLSRRMFLSIAASSALLIQRSPQGSAPVERIVRSRRPEDLEMPLEGFRDFITPIEHFFVRTHVSVPNVDAES